MSTRVESSDPSGEHDHQKRLFRFLVRSGELLLKHRKANPQSDYDHSCAIDTTSPRPVEIASDQIWVLNGSQTPYLKILFNNLVIPYQGRERTANVALVKRVGQVILEPGQFKEYCIPDSVIEEAILKTLEDFSQYYRKEHQPLLQRLRSNLHLNS